MCLQKRVRIFLFIAILAVFAGCEALDSILPSTGTYKINAKINDTSLDDFSIVTSKDKIQPFFEEPVSEDPDITALVVFLKDSRGLTTGYKVTYLLAYDDKDNNKEDDLELQVKQDEKKDDENEDILDESGEDKDNNEKLDEEENEDLAENTDPLETIEHSVKGNEIIFTVKNFDKALPFIPLPSDLPTGKYTLVFQVMSKNTVLFKSEKALYYLADMEFSFEGIQVHLPGIAENSQFIQNGNLILLEIKLDFDNRMEPYVVWYNGKKIIDEGVYSGGAGTLLWKTPEQNGFVSLRAEVFPFMDRIGLSGYQKGISLLVSSKEMDMHLFSKDTPNLVYWYTFEGDLKDSLIKNSAERVIQPAEKNKPKWLPANGTYGLASGYDNAYTLPVIPFTNSENGDWQIVSRFKPLNEGEIFFVQFGAALDVTMTLSNKKSNLVLTLASSSETSSEVLKLPDEEDSFVTASVKFFIQPGRLSAKLDFKNQNETVIKPISLEADINKEYRIMLGQKKVIADNAQTAANRRAAFTALWDELAVFHISPVELITPEIDTKELIIDTTVETIIEETAGIEAAQPEIAAAGIGLGEDLILPE